MKTITFTVFLVPLIITPCALADPLDHWTVRQQGTASAQLRGATYGAGQFVAVGGGLGTVSEAIILTSANGVNWVKQQPGVGFLLEGITYSKGQFVAVGAGPTIATSADGLNWVQRQSPLLDSFFYGAYFNGVAYGKDQFVVVGGRGLAPVIVTSPDAVNWVQPVASASGYLSRVAYGSGQYVAVGEWDFILRSNDGVIWAPIPIQKRPRLPGSTATAITYVSGQFVEVDNAGGIATSVNGLDWVVRFSPTNNLSMDGIAYGNGQLVVVGYDFSRATGLILTSTDSVTGNWVSRDSGTTNQLFGVAYGNGHFVAVGDGLTILESGPIINLSINRDAGPSLGLQSVSLSGPVGLTYSIQSPINLIAWQTVTNVISTEETTVILDAPRPESRQRFYRATSR